MKRVAGSFAPTLVVLAASIAAGAVHATENYDLRYAPGIGGADMSAPVEPGMYLQVPAWHYRGKLNEDFSTPVTTPFGSSLVTNLTGHKEITVTVDALLPRFTYMSTTQLWGATVGYTALLPLIQKKSSVSVSNIGGFVASPAAPTTDLPDAAPLPGPTTVGALRAGIVALGGPVATSAAAAATGSSGFNVGDLEVGVMLRWQKDENQFIVVPNIILPTGQYNKTDALNGIPSASAGKFYSFRPTFQFSHIGDGWDFGVRASLTFNTRNTDTKYHSGNYANIDWALMKDLPNQFRAGLEGYVVSQWTRDSVQTDASLNTPTVAQQETLDKKGNTYAVGPAFSWIKGAGELLVDGKWVKEFGSDRPKGSAIWLSVAKPFL